MTLETYDLRPQALLDLQASLIEWWASDIGSIFARGWTEMALGEKKPGVVTEEHLDRIQALVLAKASSYWVSKEMTDLVMAAGASMPPQTLRLEDLPSERGFIWFDRPLYIRDIRGRRCGLRAVTWAVRPIHLVKHAETMETIETQGISLCWYSDVTDPEDDVNRVLRESCAAEGRSWDEYASLAHRLSVFHLDAWPFGTTFVGETMPWDDVETGEHDEIMDTRRFLAAFLTLQAQRLAVTAEAQADRPSRRRLARGGILDPSKSVRVVTLRRPSRPSGEPSEEAPRWSHRWMVSGHWRNQWVPSMKDHRLTWIAPYVKGPEDRDLIVKPTVFKLAR